MAKTYVATGRYDARYVATICRFMIERGVVPEARTDPLTFAVDAIGKMVLKGTDPPSYHEAYEYLSSIGLMTDVRTKRAVYKHMQEEAFSEADLDMACLPQETPRKSLSDVSDEDIEAAIKRRQGELSEARKRFSSLSGLDIEGGEG